MSGAPVHCETRGRGPDLVLLHGWGLHGGIWETTAARLAERFRVSVVDLPGHGRSPLCEPVTLAAFVESVAAAVPARAAWIGWSLGGLVALWAAARDLGLARLALVAGTPRFVAGPGWPWGIPPAVLAGFARELEKDYRATLQRFLALQPRGPDQGREELRHLRALVFARGEPAIGALRGGLELLAKSDLRDELGQVGCPTVLIQGRRDTLVPVGAAEATAAALPDGRVEVIDGAGHAPFISHPARFVSALEAFLHE